MSEVLLLFVILFREQMYPKWLIFLILGVFERANVSQMARILDLGCIFTSDCIPNVLF